MITNIKTTDDRVIVVVQKLYDDITVSVEYGAFHEYEFGIVDNDLMRLVSVVNKMRLARDRANTMVGT